MTEKKTETKSMRIFQFHAENVKRIEIVDITPKGNDVIIEGKNKAGKSSILDTIAFLFCGKALIPKDVVRQGQEEGTASADIGEYIISRTFKKGGESFLKIEGKNGAVRPANVQTWLNDLLGSGGKNEMAYDPAMFLTMDKKKRAEVIKQMTGLDFDEIDRQYADLYASRRDYNRDMDKFKKELVSLGPVPEMRTVRTIDIVQKEYDEKHKWNETLENAKEALEKNRDEIKEGEDAIKQWVKVIEEAKKKNADLRQAVLKKPKDLSKLEQELADIKGTAGLQYKIKRKKELGVEIKKIATSLENVGIKMGEAQTGKEQMIKNAKYPVKGMTVDAEDVYLSGISFDECSQSEQIEASMLIRISQDPKLRIVFIRQASLFDETTMKRVKEICKENGFQVWIESVANKKSSKDTVYIEEGKVKG